MFYYLTSSFYVYSTFTFCCILIDGVQTVVECAVWCVCNVCLYIYIYVCLCVYGRCGDYIHSHIYMSQPIYMFLFAWMVLIRDNCDELWGQDNVCISQQHCSNILLYFVHFELGECYKMLSLFWNICEMYMTVRQVINRHHTSYTCYMYV